MIELLKPLEPYIVGTLKGFGAGAAAAGIGYLKTKDESFDGMKFTKTVILGGVVGAAGQGLGISPEKTEEYLAYPFVVYMVDVATKIVWRRALQPVYEALREALREAQK